MILSKLGLYAFHGKNSPVGKGSNLSVEIFFNYNWIVAHLALFYNGKRNIDNHIYLFDMNMTIIILII